MMSTMVVVTTTADPNQTRGDAPPWIPNDRTFGARLALVRQHMGWGNVDRAAEECGIRPNSWRNWERDNRRPMRYDETCALIAARTGCDRYWLMTGERRRGDGDVVTDRSGSRPVRNVRLRHLVVWGMDAPTSSGRPLTQPPSGRPRTGDVGPGMVRPARVPRHGAR